MLAAIDSSIKAVEDLKRKNVKLVDSRDLLN